MALANELRETNDLLRVGLSDLGQLTAAMREALKPKRIGRHSEFAPNGAVTFVPAFSALRNALVDLPQKYWQRHKDGALIVCRCRRALDVPEASFYECRCGRVFCVTHRSVKVLPLDA